MSMTRYDYTSATCAALTIKLSDKAFIPPLYYCPINKLADEGNSLIVMNVI